MYLNLKGGAPRSHAQKKWWDPKIQQGPSNQPTPLPRPYRRDISMRRRNVPEYKSPPAESPPPVTGTNIPPKAWTKHNGTLIWARCCLSWSLLCIVLLLTLLTATHTNNYHRIGLDDVSLLPTVRRNIHIAMLLYTSCAILAFYILLPIHLGPCGRQRSQPKRQKTQDR